MRSQLTASTKVALFLFGSGFCALVYQTAWLRMFRLVFGASTLASAAVLALFMAGLGFGSLWFGPRADRHRSPLGLYASLEAGIALSAALSPLLVAGVRALGHELPMYDITTGTGDFIANGVISHNCFARPTHEYLDLGAGRDSLVDVGADFDPGITIPNGGWNAPTADLAAYIGFLTGASGDSTVLSRRTLEEMWRPRVETGMDLPAFASVGLGFFVMEVGRRRVVGHTGTQAGYRSFIYISPEQKSGIIFVFNTTPSTERRAPDLARLSRTAIGLLGR